MSQDFAKKRNSGGKSGQRKSTSAATRKDARAEGQWSWFFSGMFTGLLLCVIAYLSVIRIHEISPGMEISGGQPAGENEPGATGEKFEFYEYLPEAEVEVNVVPVNIAAGNATEENPVHYLLQAGSFQVREDADALRARIILLNMEARIIPAVLSGRTWYRVQAGPFIGRAGVENAENILIANNIDSIRLRIPSR